MASPHPFCIGTYQSIPLQRDSEDSGSLHTNTLKYVDFSGIARILLYPIPV